MSAAALGVDVGGDVGHGRVGVSVGSGVSVGDGVSVGSGVFVRVGRRCAGCGVLVSVGVGVAVGGTKQAGSTRETSVVWVTESDAVPSLSSVAVFVSTVPWLRPHGTVTLITISPETAEPRAPTSQWRVEVVRRVGVMEAPA